MSESPQTDKLMAGLRDKLASISFDAANSAERCRAFRGGDAAYQSWITQHAKTGYVIRRDTSTSKTSHLHTASCPTIGPEADAKSLKSPKVGAPTKAAARAYALGKKWKLLSDCDACETGE